jgi:hypothetical protein
MSMLDAPDPATIWRPLPAYVLRLTHIHWVTEGIYITGCKRCEAEAPLMRARAQVEAEHQGQDLPRDPDWNWIDGVS